MLISYFLALWACLLGTALADCGDYACDTFVPLYGQAGDGICAFQTSGTNLFALSFIVW